MSDPLSEFDDILASLNQFGDLSTSIHSETPTPAPLQSEPSNLNAISGVSNSTDTTMAGSPETHQGSAAPSPFVATLPKPKDPSVATAPRPRDISRHSQELVILDSNPNGSRIVQSNNVVQAIVAPAAVTVNLVQSLAPPISAPVQTTGDEASVQQRDNVAVATPAAQTTRSAKPPITVGTLGLSSKAKSATVPNSPVSPSLEAGTLESCFPKGWRDQTFADPGYTNWRRGMIQHLESLPDHGCLQIPSLFPVLANLADQLAAKHGPSP